MPHAGEHNTHLGPVQCNILVDPVSGLPIPVTTDSDGIKRLAVDANLKVEHVDIGVVDQGAPTLDANGWPVKVTDGTHELVVNSDGSINVTAAPGVGLATEATQLLVKANTDHLDVDLSTRASEATVATLATETTLSALDAKVTACNTGAVVISSGTVSVTQPTVSIANIIRNDYSGTAVTTAAYVQLIASTAHQIKKLEIFDSSGQTLVLATGAAASEVDLLYVTPGGNGQISIDIAAGTRLSIKAISANATSGEIDINAYNIV